MVEVESRVTGGDEWVRSGVAAHDEVAASVDADGTRDIPGVTGHEALEVADVVVLQDEVGGVAEGVDALGDVGVQVAGQAAGVVKGRIGLASSVGRAVEREVDGTQVDSHVLKGSLKDTASSRAGSKGDGEIGEGHDDLDALVRDESTVRTEGGIAAVENGRVTGGVDVQSPLPVGEVAVVAAFAEFALVDVEVVPVPGEEVALFNGKEMLAPAGLGEGCVIGEERVGGSDTGKKGECEKAARRKGNREAGSGGGLTGCLEHARGDIPSSEWWASASCAQRQSHHTATSTPGRRPREAS